DRGVREGGTEAPLPAVHRDSRDGGDRGGPTDGHTRPPLPQPDLAGGGAGPRPAAHPVDRPPETGVHLPLITTTVRALMIFRAVEIGDHRRAATNRADNPSVPPGWPGPTRPGSNGGQHVSDSRRRPDTVRPVPASGVEALRRP